MRSSRSALVVAHSRWFARLCLRRRRPNRVHQAAYAFASVDPKFITCCGPLRSSHAESVFNHNGGNVRFLAISSALQVPGSHPFVFPMWLLSTTPRPSSTCRAASRPPSWCCALRSRLSVAAALTCVWPMLQGFGINDNGDWEEREVSVPIHPRLCCCLALAFARPRRRTVSRSPFQRPRVCELMFPAPCCSRFPRRACM